MVTPKNNYYKFHSIFAYNAVFNFIVGLRGVGKSFGAKEIVIKAAIKNGEQFIYLRRYKTELTTSRNTFFADIAYKFPEYDFRINGNFAQAAPVETREDKKRAWSTIGYFIALSTSQNQKSVAFPLVKTIIFDEFIIEKGAIRYLPDEVTVMTNFYSTVARKREGVKVLFLANSVSIMNPYFLEYEIIPTTGREFISKFDGFVVAHFPNAEDFKGEVYETRFGKFIQGSEYASYAVENEFADNNDALLGVKDPKARPLFILETAKGSFSVWQNFFSGEYWVYQKLPKLDEIYTLLPEKMDSDKKLMRINDRPMVQLRTAFGRAMVTFDKPATRNTFTEIFKR